MVFGQMLTKQDVRVHAGLLAAVQHAQEEQKPDFSPETRLGALEWARKYALVRTARGDVFRFADVERPYQTAILSDTSDRQIVGKSRQIGISQTYAFVAAEEAVSGGTVLVISKNLEQAALFLAYVYTALLDAPHPGFLKQNTYNLKFRNGGQIICQPATKKAGRGIAATLVIMDEAAWQEYASVIYTAVLPTLATTNGTLVMLSTPNGTGNLFEEKWAIALDQNGLEEEDADRDRTTEVTIEEVIKRRALKRKTQDSDGAPIPIGGDEQWSVHYLPWWVHPDWDEAWARKTANDMGLVEFSQEHAVDFQGSGANLFPSALIRALFSDYDPRREFLGLPPLDLSLRAAIPGHRHVNAFDIARANDAFCGFSIDIDVTPFQVVHIEYHHRLDYPVQAEVIDQVDEDYPGRTYVESNGAGDPLIAFCHRHVEPFFMTVLGKKNALDSLLLLMQQGELKVPEFSVLRKELRKYTRNDKNLQQDTVMALAIAALFAGRPAADSTVAAGGDRSGLSVDQVVSALSVLAGQRADPSRLAREIRRASVPADHWSRDPDKDGRSRARSSAPRSARMGGRRHGGEE